jgi:hypothetical protein
VGLKETRVIIFITTILLLAGNLQADQITSIQLVGDFEGITCEPADSANDMVEIDNHLWRKLKLINEPYDPDTIQFKFTKNRSFFPENWGWCDSLGWGIAELDYDPPNIVAILPDSGYYYFHFNDSTYHYQLTRPDGVIKGFVTTENNGTGVPPGTKVTLHHPIDDIIGCYTSFSDSLFIFQNLPPSTYSLSASAPGHRDTTITDLVLEESGILDVEIYLRQVTAVRISFASCERTDEGIIIRWTLGSSEDEAAFDIYRGTIPAFQETEKINSTPIRSNRRFSFVDRNHCPTEDYYYYIVEWGQENPFKYGPLHISGITTPALSSSLGQNFPNPFNPSTNIPYSIGAEDVNSSITVSFYDVSGRMVESHNLGKKSSGEYIFHWNPFSSNGGKITTGVYYCRLKVGKKLFTGKLILLR